jgi:methyltransferase (TIGR00027 family)
VVVGAGLDSFALRRHDLMKSLTVFELDHPATQHVKRERLAQLDVELPKAFEFVPIDFERESLEEALARSSFSPERRSFHSWMGTVAYLSDEAIFGTLRSIARASAAGSELVLDFACRMEDMSPEHHPAIEKLLRYTARRGEPLIGFHEPADFVRRVTQLGFELVELVPPEDHEPRFLASGRYGVRTIPFSYFAHFRRRAAR